MYCLGGRASREDGDLVLVLLQCTNTSCQPESGMKRIYMQPSCSSNRERFRKRVRERMCSRGRGRVLQRMRVRHNFSEREFQSESFGQRS